MQLDELVEDRDFKDFLQELLDENRLTGAVVGITALVIARGIAVLSSRQRDVFQWYVIDEFVVERCSRDGETIPWSEMLVAYDEQGLCSWCRNQQAKMLKDEPSLV